MGNKGAHFPARGLHVLVRDFIMLGADDDEDPVLLFICRGCGGLSYQRTALYARRGAEL